MSKKNQLFKDLSEIQHLVMSKDRKARLVGEYWELFIRIHKLSGFIDKVKRKIIPESSINGPLYLHILQVKSMKKYLGTLTIRLAIEQVDPDDATWKSFEEPAEQVSLF